MSGELVDDGTMDTVISCTECGHEERYNYANNSIDAYCDEQGIELSEIERKENYDAWVAERIKEFDEEHQCDQYQVVVGNIGTVYDGNNLEDARLNARVYVDQSKSGYGKAAGESVTVFHNGEVLDEYHGNHRGANK